MKKVIATILSVFYLSVSMAAGVNLDYCCGHLEGVQLQLTGENGKGAPACNMQHSLLKKKNCCKNVYQQLNTNCQVPNEAVSLTRLPPHPTTLPYFSGTPVFYFSSIAIGNCAPHAPPLQKTIPAYLTNCTFLI